MLKSGRPAATTVHHTRRVRPRGGASAAARGVLRLAFAGWLAATALGLGGVTLAIDAVADRHLLQEAERSSLDWGRHIGRHIPDIDLVFEGEVPSPAAQAQLAALRGTAGLFRFALYGADGELRLVSDSLGVPVAAAEPTAGASPVPHDGRPRDAARSGRHLVTLVVDPQRAGTGAFAKPSLARAAPDPDPDPDPDPTTTTTTTISPTTSPTTSPSYAETLPAVYSVAWVPVHHGQRVVGVAEIHVDQSERAALIAGSFRVAAAVAGAALGLFFTLGTALWQWRVHRERKAQKQLAYLARHDALTGVLNRGCFHAELAETCASAPVPAAEGSGSETVPPRAGFALLVVDMDRFTDVNDRLGHGAGDAMLQQVALRLRAVLRGADRVARLGGDRFAVLQAEVDDPAAVGGLAQRVVLALARPYAHAGTPFAGSASVGAVLHGPDAADADTLLHHAELALQRAKGEGRANWSIYDARLDGEQQQRRQLLQELQQAIETGALRLHFQPLRRAADGALTGYEALLRWPHPQRGMVSPAEFIPLAEHGGLIDALGRWVLARACAEAAHWPAPLSVAVNLSAVQFRRSDALVADIRAALAASGLAPQRLEVEITESLLMANTEPVLAALRALHEDGVRIAMDDFGTGYSSLAYLWRFPFDKLKIDGAFTRGLGSGDGKAGVVVQAIVSLAHALGIKVNAEGVETEAQRAALVRAGCDELQGWLLGRPAPPHELPHVAPPQGSSSADATTSAASSASASAPLSAPAEDYLISQRSTDPATRA